MKNALRNALGLVVTAGAVMVAPAAFAAYKCELYDRAESAPGGDVPVQVLYTDSTDFEAAKAACSGKIDRRNIIDYWLKWVEKRDLPQNWKDSDLFAGSVPEEVTAPVPAPQPEAGEEPAPKDEQGYVCFIYDTKNLGYDKPYSSLFTDKRSVEEVKEACISAMRAALPAGSRDYEVRWMDILPENWEVSPLF